MNDELILRTYLLDVNLEAHAEDSGLPLSGAVGYLNFPLCAVSEIERNIQSRECWPEIHTFEVLFVARFLYKNRRELVSFKIFVLELGC